MFQFFQKSIFDPNTCTTPKSPKNGFRWCPLGKLSHLGMEQLRRYVITFLFSTTYFCVTFRFVRPDWSNELKHIWRLKNSIIKGKDIISEAFIKSLLFRECLLFVTPPPFLRMGVSSKLKNDKYYKYGENKIKSRRRNLRVRVDLYEFILCSFF